MYQAQHHLPPPHLPPPPQHQYPHHPATTAPPPAYVAPYPPHAPHLHAPAPYPPHAAAAAHHPPPAHDPYLQQRHHAEIQDSISKKIAMEKYQRMNSGGVPNPLPQVVLDPQPVAPPKGPPSPAVQAISVIRCAPLIITTISQPLRMGARGFSKASVASA